MTLLDISISIGVHRTTIGRLEQGYPAISIGILYQLLKILGSAKNINKNTPLDFSETDIQ